MSGGDERRLRPSDDGFARRPTARAVDGVGVLRVQREGAPTHDPQGVVYNENKTPTGENLNLGTLEALVEPYPQVTAGTPHSWGFDRNSATFTFHYSTRSADGMRSFPSGSVTQIATPRLSYPKGYAAQVSGGKVVSRSGARVMRV